MSFRNQENSSLNKKGSQQDNNRLQTNESKVSLDTSKIIEKSPN
jgi:hypothetical protein